MRKATFKEKHCGRRYDAHNVYLVYEYRGYEYTVCENWAKGNEPLAWQHRAEQNRIDRLTERGGRPMEPVEPCRYEDTAEYGIDQFLRFVDGEPSGFDKEGKH